MENCTENGCNGKIYEQSPVAVMTSCSTMSRAICNNSCPGIYPKNAYPCKKCGRLYWEDGTPIFNEKREKSFFENGNVISRK